VEYNVLLGLIKFGLGLKVLVQRDLDLGRKKLASFDFSGDL